MKKNEYVYSIINIIISVAIIIFEIFVVIPFAEKGNFFSEGSSPTGNITVYRLITLIPMALYGISLFICLPKIKTLKGLCYSVSSITLLLMIFAGFGAAGGFILLFFLPFLVIGAIISSIIKKLSNNKSKDNPNNASDYQQKMIEYKINSLCLISMVLSVLSIYTAWIVFAIAGIIIGIIGIIRFNPETQKGKILGIVGIIIGAYKLMVLL